MGKNKTGKLNLSAPWETYARKVNALFEKDPQVKVDWDPKDLVLTLRVDNPSKAEALSLLFEDEVHFGSVTVKVVIIPSNSEDETSWMDILEVAFKGNPAVSYTQRTYGPGFSGNYIVFRPEVVQFFNDDLGSINGMKSTLYEDIARELFDVKGVFYCTDLVE